MENTILIQNGETLVITPEMSSGVNSITAKEGSSLILQGAELELDTLISTGAFTLSGYGSIRIKDTMSIADKSTVDLSSISLILMPSQTTSSNGLSIGFDCNLTLRDFPIVGIGEAATISFTETKTLSANQTTINPSGATIHLNAPCRQIFKNVIIKGEVLCEEAYPEWFVEDSKSNPCSDWSQAINQAFNLAANGVVRLQSRKYLVRTTIYVPTRGQLRGTGSGMWNTTTKTNSSGDSTIVGTTIGTKISVNTNPQFTAGCVVLVSYNREIVNKVVVGKSSRDAFELLRNPNSDEVYMQSFVFPGGIISDIRFENTTYNSENADLCCVLVNGCMSFQNDVFDYFRSGIVWSWQYNDQKEVIRCTFKHDRNQTVSDYLLDFGHLGDALVCQANHFISSSCERSQFLKIYGCMGGSISDNIINGDVYISGCKGLNFTGNHMENGAQITIFSSEVNFTNNYFEKGLRPNILIKSDINFDVPVINFTNNIFVYISGIRPLLKDGTWHYTTLENDLANYDKDKYVSITEISDYDIELRGEARETGVDTNVFYPHGPVATIHLSNNYRYWVPTGQASHSYPGGIKICKSYLNVYADDNSKTSFIGDTTPVDNFNNRSQLYSTQSTLFISNDVTIYSPCVTMKGLASASAHVHGLTNNTQWLRNQSPMVRLQQSFSYYYQFIWDIEQSLVTPSAKSSPLQIMTDSKGGTAFQPASDQGVLISVGVGKGFGATAMIRVIRKINKNLSFGGPAIAYVDVPLITCRELFDNGPTLNGYRWQSVDSVDAATIQGSTPDKITYMGEDIVVS